MDMITTVKPVKKSGSSLNVYLTRELKLLGVGIGDTIEIVIKRIRSDDDDDDTDDENE